MSFGVTTTVSGDTMNSFVKRADEGLYKAKESGRNRVVVNWYKAKTGLERSSPVFYRNSSIKEEI